MIQQGRVYVSPLLAEELTDNLFQLPHNEKNREYDRLTVREKEVLKLIAEGRSTREIADQLSVSAKTVETHRSQLMERLSIHNVPGLVKFAIRNGLVDIEST